MGFGWFRTFFFSLFAWKTQVLAPDKNSLFLQKNVFCFPIESGWKTMKQNKQNLNASRWNTFRVSAPLQWQQQTQKVLKFISS